MLRQCLEAKSSQTYIYKNFTLIKKRLNWFFVADTSVHQRLHQKYGSPIPTKEIKK